MIAPEELPARLADSQVMQEAVSALGGSGGVWVVGGAIRDALSGRPVLDLDLAVSGSAEEGARGIAGATGGTAFGLSEEFGAWRVVGPARAWRIDVAALRGDSIEADLAERDFTINAMATPLEGGELIDPSGGVSDLAEGIVRMVSARAFDDDPLRLLRGPRIAAELDLEIESETARAARERAGRACEPAGERQFSELRLAVAGRDPLRALELMDELGVTGIVLPELEALRGVEQNAFHHLDVHDHTRAVLAEWLQIERDPGAILGHGDEISDHLEEPLADELTRGEAIRFAALCHDMGKPRTRSVNDEGRVLFMGHDEAGANLVREMCERLRTSRRLSHHLELITLHHLDLGFMVNRRPLARSDVYRYLSETEPITVDVTLLSVADRLATRGERTRQAAIEAHVELASDMVEEGLRWKESPPTAPVDGSELCEELGIEPGPEVGRLLARLRAAAFTGEIDDREGALEMAREALQ